MAYLVPQQLVELLWSVPFPSGPVPGRRPSVLTRRGPGAGRQRDADTPRPTIGFPVAARRTARPPRDTWPAWASARSRRKAPAAQQAPLRREEDDQLRRDGVDETRAKRSEAKRTRDVAPARGARHDRTVAWKASAVVGRRAKGTSAGVAPKIGTGLSSHVYLCSTNGSGSAARSGRLIELLGH